MPGNSSKSARRRAVETGLPTILSRLWRYAIVLSGASDVADDLVQATCVRALERCEQFDPDTALDRWTFTILSSIWRNELRSRKVRTGKGQIDAEQALVADLSADMETNIFAHQVIREVMRLPEGQRATVLLVYVEGLTYREAAKILDIPEGTVMSRLASARSKLADMGREEQAQPQRANRPMK